MDPKQNAQEKESKLEKFMNSIEDKLDAFMYAVEKVSDKVFLSIEFFFDKVFKLLENNYDLLRYASFPWSLVYPVVWEKWYQSKYEGIPTDKEGIHFLRAPVGGGKSLTSLVLAERTLKLTGKPAYLTSQVEKPTKAFDDITGEEYWFVMHRVQKLDEIYVDGKRVKEWDSENYPDIYKDERHLRFNPRMNKTSDYNKAWLIEHEDELLMRHDGFKRIYKFSQHMKLDSQEMETAVYMHDIRAIKGLPPMQWLRDGLFRIYPYKIKFETYRIKYEFDGSMKRELVKVWYLPVPSYVLDKFDTHAERRKNKKEVNPDVSK